MLGRNGVLTAALRSVSVVLERTKSYGAAVNRLRIGSTGVRGAEAKRWRQRRSRGPRASTSACPLRRRLVRSGASGRRGWWMRSWKSSGGWASRSRSGAKWKPSGTASPRSLSGRPPAMDMHDTLTSMLHRRRRTGRPVAAPHPYSPVQIRTLLESPPPVRVVIPGLVYRNDPFDTSHAPAFSQIEGLAVDEGISFVDLKATLVHFAHHSSRRRPRFASVPRSFPSPSLRRRWTSSASSATAPAVPAQGNRMDGDSRCGMVHPAVFEHTGVDAERYTGWAFGMGPQESRCCATAFPTSVCSTMATCAFSNQFVPGNGSGQHG